jgi:ubiquinone/menaquinone biosynthesis C-methylase UbiE
MPRPQRQPFPPRKGGPPGSRPAAKNSEQSLGWDPVAAWYDKLVGESGSDYHRHVILPAALRLLAPQAGEAVIDVCCGQGVLAPPLLAAGIARFTGVDASPRLIDAAKSRHRNEPRVSWIQSDACKPGAWTDGSYDAASCLMAVHDVEDIGGLFANIRRSLKVGGRAVAILMHPCFRIPRKSHWGWDADQKIQFRRLDSYGTPIAIPITTHPGKGTGEETLFHHRSLADLLNALASNGLALAACEELYSHRRSQGSGPFSKAEHKAAEEFPLFLALKATRID